MNRYFIIAILLSITLLIILVIRKNKKDLTLFKKQLQEDYKKHKNPENDSDTEEHTH